MQNSKPFRLYHTTAFRIFIVILTAGLGININSCNKKLTILSNLIAGSK
ncbi:MAG: hypothetical protein GXO97_09960 [Nitrospirae bacterium]|nr:hypothetical protein [Nitrospirota bacterium]